MIQIGDCVTWTSQSGGSTKEKTGVVVGVVDIGRKFETWNILVPIGQYRKMFDGYYRNELSYLVLVTPKGKAKPKLYRPYTKDLKVGGGCE